MCVISDKRNALDWLSEKHETQKVVTFSLNLNFFRLPLTSYLNFVGDTPPLRPTTTATNSGRDIFAPNSHYKWRILTTSPCPQTQVLRYARASVIPIQYPHSRTQVNMLAGALVRKFCQQTKKKFIEVWTSSSSSQAGISEHAVMFPVDSIKVNFFRSCLSFLTLTVS